jgi:hypothetical protein
MTRLLKFSSDLREGDRHPGPRSGIQVPDSCFRKNDGQNGRQGKFECLNLSARSFSATIITRLEFMDRDAAINLAPFSSKDKYQAPTGAAGQKDKKHAKT